MRILLHSLHFSTRTVKLLFGPAVGAAELTVWPAWSTVRGVICFFPSTYLCRVDSKVLNLTSWCPWKRIMDVRKNEFNMINGRSISTLFAFYEHQQLLELLKFPTFAPFASFPSTVRVKRYSLLSAPKKRSATWPRTCDSWLNCSNKKNMAVSRLHLIILFNDKSTTMHKPLDRARMQIHDCCLVVLLQSLQTSGIRW